VDSILNSQGGQLAALSVFENVVVTCHATWHDMDTLLSTRRGAEMNTVPAQELKRRGLAALDDLIVNGDVHLIRNNRPEYVVLTEARYQELVADAEEAYVARVKASLAEVKAGRVRRFASAEELLQAIDAAGE